MPRLNIENSIHTDARFDELKFRLGSREAAMGAMVYAWLLAQKWYITPEKMIPKSEWDAQRICPLILEVGLAELVGDKVRMRGADEQFGWLAERRESGRRGGLQSAAQRMRNHSGNGSSSAQANPSKSNPLPLSLKSPSIKPLEENPVNIQSPLPPLAATTRVDEAALEIAARAWGETLTHFGVPKDPRLDAHTLARLITAHGLELTVHALRGMALEEATENFNPRKHLSLARLAKPANFEKFTHLGMAASKQVTRKLLKPRITAPMGADGAKTDPDDG